jgi:glycosyltransferase involved in cell wall biosynthesis
MERFDGIKFLSVGRICHAKNYDNVPYIAQTLKQMGLRFKWFIVGPGDHSSIDETIARTNTNDVVQFLGPKDNPYPYMNACDIYVQPSRYEGKSVTVREAQILSKPVVITAYPTAKSQIIDGTDGVIVPMDNEECARGIAGVIADKVLQERIINYVSAHDYSNEHEVEKIYELL